MINNISGKMDFSILHQPLFVGPGLMLGKIHEIFLRSNEELSSLSSPQDGKIAEEIEAGRKIGMDVIHWWVFDRESDIGELSKRNNEALGFVQALKNDSARLVKKEIKNYEDLITVLAVCRRE